MNNKKRLTVEMLKKYCRDKFRKNDMDHRVCEQRHKACEHRIKYLEQTFFKIQHSGKDE